MLTTLRDIGLILVCVLVLGIACFELYDHLFDRTPTNGRG